MHKDIEIPESSKFPPSIMEEKIEMLEIKVTMLKDLAHELDPYQEITEEMKHRLMFFGIDEFYDPFYITNQLLLLLENNLEKLENLKSSDVF